MSLNDLFTDKICKLNERRTDKFGSGNAAFYEELFSPVKNDLKKFLEIGIGRGGDIELWKYLFPSAILYFLDIDSKAQFDEPNRVVTAKVNQGSIDELENFINRAGKDYDAIVDDGSHMSSHQILTFKMLWPTLNGKSWYIIEDTETSYSEKHVDQPLTCVQYFKDLAEELSNPNTNINLDIDSIVFRKNMILVKKQ